MIIDTIKKEAFCCPQTKDMHLLCYTEDNPNGMQNSSLMHLKDERIVYQNVLALNIHREDKEGFCAKSSILTGKYNGSANDDNVYENTAYLKNKAIYPISFLFFKDKGKIKISNYFS